MSRVSVSSSPRASSFLRQRVHETRVCTHISVATRGGPDRSSPVILGRVLTSNMRPLQHLYRSSPRRHHLRAFPRASVYTRRVIRVTHDPFSASLYPRRVHRRYIEEMGDTFKGRAGRPSFVQQMRSARPARCPHHPTPVFDSKRDKIARVKLEPLRRTVLNERFQMSNVV